MEYTLLVNGIPFPVTRSLIEPQSLPPIRVYNVSKTSYGVPWVDSRPGLLHNPWRSLQACQRSIIQPREEGNAFSHFCDRQSAGGTPIQISLINNDGVVLIPASWVELNYNRTSYSTIDHQVKLSFNCDQLIGYVGKASILFEYNGSFLIPKVIQIRG